MFVDRKSSQMEIPMNTKILTVLKCIRINPVEGCVGMVVKGYFICTQEGMVDVWEWTLH